MRRIGMGSKYAKEMEEIRNEFNELKSNLERVINSLNEKDERYEQLLNGEEEKYKEIKKSHDLIDEYRDELFADEGVKEDIEQLHNELKENNEKTKKILTDITECRKSFEEECASNKEKLNEFSISFNENVNKIEELLPGATAAGLAEAYNIVITEQKKSRKHWTWIFSVSLLCIFALMCILLGFGIVSFQTTDSLQDTFIKLVRIASLEFPFVWMAMVSTRKINQLMALIEEYRYKWTTMRVYDGMNKAVKNMDVAETEENQEVLLFNQLLNAVKKNPTKRLENIKSDDVLSKTKDLICELRDLKNKNNEK